MLAAILGGHGPVAGVLAASGPQEGTSLQGRKGAFVIPVAVSSSPEHWKTAGCVGVAQPAESWGLAPRTPEVPTVGLGTTQIKNGPWGSVPPGPACSLRQINNYLTVPAHKLDSPTMSRARIGSGKGRTWTGLLGYVPHAEARAASFWCGSIEWLCGGPQERDTLEAVVLAHVNTRAGLRGGVRKGGHPGQPLGQ